MLGRRALAANQRADGEGVFTPSVRWFGVWSRNHFGGADWAIRSYISRAKKDQRGPEPEFAVMPPFDAFSAPAFEQAGRWATGDRSKIERGRDLGHTVVIGVIDDRTRLAYCELHSAENATNVSITLARAARSFSDQGCGPVEAVVSDNAECYAASHAFKNTLADLAACHILIPPYTPRWSVKIERFFATLDTE